MSGLSDTAGLSYSESLWNRISGLWGGFTGLSGRDLINKVILQESGFAVLQEDGSYMLTE